MRTTLTVCFEGNQFQFDRSIIFIVSVLCSRVVTHFYCFCQENAGVKYRKGLALCDLFVAQEALYLILGGDVQDTELIAETCIYIIL